MKPLTQEQLQHAVKTLALLQSRNFPLTQGLATLEASHPAWIEVKSQVQKGDTVGQALKRYPHVFSPFFSGMVESAEKSPQGDVILQSLSSWLEVAEEVRRKVRELLHYPILLLSFLLVEIGVLVGMALPSLILPLALINNPGSWTQYNSIFSFSSYFFFLLAGLCLLASYKTEWLLPLTLKFPSFRATLLRSDQALWARAVASYLQGGRTLSEALRACSGIVWTEDLRRELETLPAHLEQGDLFSQALNRLDLIDPHLRWSVTAGESKEDLSGTLFFAAEQLERNLLSQCRAFFIFLQPCAVALVGLLTGAVLAAFWWSFYHYTWNVMS